MSAEEKKVQEIRQATLDFDEVIRRAKKILELDNPAEVNYKLNTLALQAGYRDQTALEKLIVDQISFEESKDIMSIQRFIRGQSMRYWLLVWRFSRLTKAYHLPCDPFFTHCLAKSMFISSTIGNKPSMVVTVVSKTGLKRCTPVRKIASP